MSSADQPDNRARRPDRDPPVGDTTDAVTDPPPRSAQGFVYEDPDEYDRHLAEDPDGPAGSPDDGEPAAPDAAGRVGRDVAVGVVGLLVGFVAAFVVVALGTTDAGVDAGELAAAQERVAALEADLAQREAELAAVEERVVALEADLAQREAELAEAEAAAGERAADVEAQREALDQRATALDERARALDERESAVERREVELAEREPGEPEPPGVPELPLIDDEATRTIIDRVVDQIRELFQQQDS